ncbi:L-malate permease [Burkholderia lata]|uniref:L-malate permease n=1 Tax=Burkholderia lata (strain ATCC 17760 / DSM 23089 / LMG 22485 / NCIMB 9086 / R18194 / 383) TaxID=482957 RepID=A0A6P2RMQ3_BURL3|nr:2-hydroxycarboxylate transporter family protein [Burkholderia lata]VWC37775.1 L-malate permease [Burkholderia lata]
MICASIVIAMVGSVVFVNAAQKMYPLESAIITACHNKLGSTGDVAIRPSSTWMELMPFAQISMRIDSVMMVVFATLVMKWLN